MHQSEPLRVAVIGASPEGFGARAHIPGAQAAPGVELIAVCTAHESTARAAATKWDIPRWYGDVAGLLADEDVELVTIAVKPRDHHWMAKAVLDAGKAVYCEWPLARATDEAAEMADRASELQAPTGVGLQGRWVPAVRYLRELIANGDIGRPIAFRAVQGLPRFDVASDRAWLSHDSEASGALFVASAHVSDTLRFVLGEPQELVGLTTTLLPDDRFSDSGQPFSWEASDYVSYLATLESGVVGSLGVSNVADPPAGFSLHVLGDEGRALITASGYLQFTPMAVSVGAKGQTMNRVAVPKRLLAGTTLSEDHAGANVGRSLAAFAGAIRDGSTFQPGFADGVQLHRIIDAVVASTASRSWVAV